MRNLFNILKWFIVLLLVFSLALFIYVIVKVQEPLKTSAVEKTFVISPGEATQQIAKNLEQEGLISRAIFFKLYVFFKKQGNKIQAGNYRLSSTMSISEIAEVLVLGKALSDEVKFIVIEGWTLADIAKALRDAKIIETQGEFLRATEQDYSAEYQFLKDLPKKEGTNLEGFLFPDTYLLSKDALPEGIIKKMLSNFDRKLSSDLRLVISEQKKTIYEIVILASIIEREVGRNVEKGEKLSRQDYEKIQQERRLVAGVFYNRLENRMPLESDATVTYITGRKAARATLEETKINSPYNTYKYLGLPPGPISNPSLDSILAVIYPAKTDYLYFLTAPDGTAYFAKTLEEHISNREKYLK